MLLETERLLLRRIRLSDTDALYRLHCDPLVVRLTTDGHAMTQRQSDKRLDLYLEEWTRFGFGFFIVYEKQPNGDLHFSGRCGLRNFNGADVELGYCFAGASSGRGLATEAAKSVIHDAFSRLALERLVGVVRPTNNQSQRVLEKLGFSYREIINHRGVDYRFYELTPFMTGASLRTKSR
ncbi:GNAT family N-acetyltransferase [Mesorhizobium sp. SB112]|uniref:GNAT family N-acetyltransferase n=1 Tax=Mesorhizobium sp. SB112 TaxID=3151853 RepID=UPI003267F3DE